MTFKVSNLGSERPHLHRAYVLGVYNNLGSTVKMHFKGNGFIVNGSKLSDEGYHKCILKVKKSMKIFVWLVKTRGAL